jgi:DNA-directed RNA polymerase specialized sigma24 family protein
MMPSKINKLKNYIENIGKHYNVPYLDDYVQEVFLALFEKGEPFIQELEANSKLNPYIYKVCVYQLLSVNSPYYRTYRPQSLVT